MAAAWAPSVDGLNQLLNLFRTSATANNEQHREIQQQLTNFNSIPDYNNYLVYILNSLKDENPSVRQMAGLVLKNNIKDRWLQLPGDVQSYVKDNLLGAVGDANPFIRSAVGSCVTTVVTAGGLDAWPQLIPSLYQQLDSADQAVLEGAYGALLKICEDSADTLALQHGSSSALALLVPKFLNGFSSPNEFVRKSALGCVNPFVQVMAEPLAANLDRYLQGLFALAVDQSPEVRKRVCQALVTLLDVHLECLLPHLKQVIEYMLISTKDADELVALEACEFWSAICETRIARDYLGEYLPRLIPVLLDGMVYTEFDLMVLGADEEDEYVADRPEDIKPHFHRAKVAGSGGGGGGGGGGGSGEAAGAAAAGGDGDDEEEDEDEEDDDDDDDVLEWNLRKCSASGLDILAGLFQRDLLPTLLPLLQAKLSDARWEVRESAILALGAIAEGCVEHMADYLPQLVPWLIQTLADAKPLIRSIGCWTLSRYAKWIVGTPPAEQYFQPLMQEMLKRVLDNNKKVQEAACSAFATVEEEAGSALVPYLGPIIHNLMFAFSKYQAKNLIILYDAIGTLADAVGAALCKPELVQVLMPPLIGRWNALSDDERALFPLLECLTSVAQALGHGFRDFAEPVLARCLRLIERNLKQPQPGEPLVNAGEGPDSDFIVCALDLVSGLAEGLGSAVEQLIAHSTLLPLLYACMRAEQSEVRQSAYALVGDLSKSCPAVLRPAYGEIVPLLVSQLNPEYVSVCNNATWAVGEIAVKVGSEMRSFVPELVAQLVPIINRPNLNKSLLENTAITLGRLGLIAPDLVSPLLEQFVHPWCSSLRNIRDDVEKEHAFQGLCEMIKLNPRGVIPHFVHLCDAIASWQTPPAELDVMFRQILTGYKSSVAPDAWAQYYATFPDYMRVRLTQRYGI